MFKIYEDGKIELTKGDTARIKETIYDEIGKVYSPSVTDIITFEIYRDRDSETALLSYTGIEFVVLASDTDNLPRGQYWYKWYIMLSNGDKNTLAENVFYLR